MKIRYSAIAEMQEAKQKILQQLQENETWATRIVQQIRACELATRSELLDLSEVSDKISIIRASLFELDKTLEIVGTNASAISQTQTKEDNDKARNGEQSKQTSSTIDEQGSED